MGADRGGDRGQTKAGSIKVLAMIFFLFFRIKHNIFIYRRNYCKKDKEIIYNNLFRIPDLPIYPSIPPFPPVLLFSYP